jgi:invasion protein IalB
VTKDKDGKEEKKDLNICLTHHERLDGNTGMVLVSAAVRQVQGQDKQHFMVMVPLGMMLQAGMRATLYPKDAWEKVQKSEQVDESKLKAVKLAYTLCHPAGCTAEMEATPELLNDLKTGGGLVVFAINAAGAPVGFPVPLVGFDQSFAGAPVDNKQYGEARRALMQQIQARQQELYEQQKKQMEEQKKGAPAAQAAACSVRLLQEQRAVVAVGLQLEQLPDLRVAQRRPRAIGQQVLLGHVGHVLGVGVLGKQVVERLVLARAHLRWNGLPPFLGVVEDWVDIENDAAEGMHAMAHDLPDPKFRPPDTAHGQVPTVSPTV